MQRTGILVVDDSAETLRLLTGILASEGYQVRPADNGEIALAHAAAEPPELILLDIRMPGLDGFEVFRRLRARQESRDIPVIFISTSTALEDRVEGMALGAIDFILKPFHRDELLARVRTHLELIRHRISLQARVDERTGGPCVDCDALREREEHFRTLVEFSSDWVWVVDQNGRYTYASPKVKDLLGYDAQEVLGKKPFDFMPKDEAERVSRAFAEIVQTRGPFAGLENVNVRKDGRRVVLETSGVPIIDELGVLRGYRGIDRDITERKRAELALRESEERYRTLLHSIPQKVFYKDRNSIYIAVNASYARDFLVSPDEFVGKSDFDFYSHDLAEKYCSDDRRVMESGATYEFDESYEYEGEKRTVHTLKTAVRDDKGDVVGVLGIFWDVTELIELDELKDQFILVAAHELKTPIAIMKGYAQALQRTAEKLPEPRRKMLAAISRGADKINGIAQNLVDVSRIHLGELDLLKEKINLSELVEGVVNRMALTTDRHQIRFVQELPVIVRGDRERLELVLSNLIDNAIRYSPNGGPIEVALAEQDHEAVVSIADHGVGIPRQKQRNIFGRFYRAHTGTPYDFGGMGVGLYISREVVRRHGGRMWFESEEGKGSTFYLSLPLEGA